MGRMLKKGKLFNCCEQFLRTPEIRQRIPNFYKTPCLKLASAFGQGVSHRGSICGAISGAAMALGFKYGTDGTEDPEAFYKKRRKLESALRILIEKFEKKFGAINCQDLLGFGVWTKEGREKFLKLMVAGKLKCQDYIDFSAKLTSKLLEE